MNSSFFVAEALLLPCLTATRYHAMVTIGSIRSALHRIAQVLCGTHGGLVRVVVPSSQEPRVYIVALPSEIAGEIYTYLCEELGVTIPSGTDPLVLTADGAAGVVRLARELAPLEAEAARGELKQR